MRVKHDYIPRNDVKLIEWSKNMIEYADAHSQAFQAPKPSALMRTQLEDLEQCVAKCHSPNAGKIDVAQKNETKRAFVKECRGYVQGFLARNPYVSDIDRHNMQIAVHDTTHTTVPVPEGKAEADIQFISRAQLQLILKHVPGSPVDVRAEHGFRIFYGVYNAHDVQPVSGKDLRESMFTRHKKVLFDFQPEDVGKTAYFCIRYENSKGQTGPWGQMVSTLIP